MFLNICVTIAVVILIIYIYFRRKPSIKEGLGSSVAPPEISGNTVIYKGMQYRTLSGLDPNGPTKPLQLKCEGCSAPYNGPPLTKSPLRCSTCFSTPSCDRTFRPIPAGWKFAQDNADSIKVAQSYSWSTLILLFGATGPSVLVNIDKSKLSQSVQAAAPTGDAAIEAAGSWAGQPDSAVPANQVSGVFSATAGKDTAYYATMHGLGLDWVNNQQPGEPAPDGVAIGHDGQGGYLTLACWTAILLSKSVAPPSGVGCKSGEILPGGDSCSVQCISGETITKQGSFDYSCSPTGLVAPTAQCGSVVKCPSPDTQLSPCNIPSFTKGTRGGSSGPCKPGTYLQSGDFCTIQCVAGYNSNSGTSQYHCSNGTMDKKPGLQCTPPEGCTITSLGPGVMAASKNGCIVPETLKKSPPCTINLPNGYTGCGTTLAAGASCKASCDSYYTPNKGSMTYTCPPTGTVDISGVGDLICTPPCPVPLTNVTGGVNCSSGVLAAGASCNTSCLPFYTGTGGSYTCSKDGTTLTPSSVPAACNAPSCHVTATNATGCGPTLAAGGSCTATCDTGYVGGGTYTCSADGTLSPGGACTAAPTCNFIIGSHMTTGSNCPGGVLEAGQSCQTSCPAPYIGSSGSYTCDSTGNLTSSPGACRKPSGTCKSILWPVPENQWKYQGGTCLSALDNGGNGMSPGTCAAAGDNKESCQAAAKHMTAMMNVFCDMNGTCTKCGCQWVYPQSCVATDDCPTDEQLT